MHVRMQEDVSDIHHGLLSAEESDETEIERCESQEVGRDRQ